MVQPGVIRGQVVMELFFFGTIKLKTAVNTAAPTIDQTIGKLMFPTFIDQKSGKLNSRAKIVPMYAPINPTTIEIIPLFPCRPAILSPT